MILRRTSFVLLLAVAAVLATVAAPAVAAPGKASVVIRHAVHGCHVWSVNGSAYGASQSIALKRGSSLVVTDNDVMPHTLVLSSGPSLRIANARLAHMGASTTVTLMRPGVYHFTTKAGEDYKGMTGLKTIGEDNVLKLTVRVS